METIYGENWGLSIAVSAVLTWGIGLAPPLLLRFVFFRRPFGKWWAIGTVSIFWVFNLMLFLALGSQSKTHGALFLVAIVSFFILRKRAKEEQPLNEKNRAPIPEKTVFNTRQDSNESNDIERGLEEVSIDKILTVENAEKELEKSLINLNTLKDKNILNDAEFEAAENKAQKLYERQKQINEQRVSEHELREELDNNLADLTTLHQQGVLDNSAYAVAKERLFKTLSEKGVEIEGAVVHKGFVIVNDGDKYIVDGKEYASLDTAKAYVDHYKN